MPLSGTGCNVLAHQVYDRKIISAFIIDETVIQIGWKHYLLWIATEPFGRSFLEFTFLSVEICLL